MSDEQKWAVGQVVSLMIVTNRAVITAIYAESAEVKITRGEDEFLVQVPLRVLKPVSPYDSSEDIG